MIGCVRLRLIMNDVTTQLPLMAVGMRFRPYCVSMFLLQMNSMGRVHVVFMTLCPMYILAQGGYCPYEKCYCYENTIDCSNDELTELPELTPVDVTELLFLSISNNQLTDIPAGRLPLGLSSIDFQQNPIRTVAADAFRDVADNLTELTFSQALFTDLPKALLQLNNLKYLALADMQLTTWDVEILKHIGLTLQTLIISNLGLTAWPSWVQFLPHLGTLELSSMMFQFPDEALDKQINTLFSINFENCSLTEMPKAISKLIHLEYLVLDSNSITRIAGLPNATNCTMLSFDHNKISDAEHLSEELRPVAGFLTTLQLSGNRLQSVPDLSGLSKLNSLYLTQNAITRVGSGKVPPSLNYIDIENNNLPSLYYFMQTGLHLNTLRFDYNVVLDIRDVDIPISVSDMSITFNQITELTNRSFPVDSEMGILTLDFNPISKIAISAFTNLKKLAYVSLTNTQLTRLPLALSALTNLKTVSLDRNAHLVCTCMEKSLRDWFLSLEVNGDCGLTSIVYFFQFMSDQCPN